MCGKVFTKTYNLTVHMRMHQDIRPFPCSICEQTFRQKAHLQRHEATHGIDSTANRKRRKRPMIDDFNDINRRADNESDEDMYRSFGEVKRKFSVGTMKNEEEEEDEMDVDPMIEPIDGSQVAKANGNRVRRRDDIASWHKPMELDFYLLFVGPGGGGIDFKSFANLEKYFY